MLTRVIQPWNSSFIITILNKVITKHNTMTKSGITARMRCAFELMREWGKIQREATDDEGGKGGSGGWGYCPARLVGRRRLTSVVSLVEEGPRAVLGGRVEREEGWSRLAAGRGLQQGTRR